jgi:hypothetical protein
MKLISHLDTAMQGDPRDLPRIVTQHPPAGRGGDTGQKGRAAMPGARLAAPVPVGAEAEAELTAMHAVLAELLPLSGPARARVIKWCEEILASESPAPQPDIDEVDLGAFHH